MLIRVNFSLKMNLFRFYSRFSSILTIRKMSKSVLVFLAPGAEEMETVITVDVLRRAGINVTLGGVNSSEPVLCSRNVRVVPDEDLSNVKNKTFDAVIIPGGLNGAATCAADVTVGDILTRHYESGKLVAAICAGPTALLSHKIGLGKSLTSYPAFKEKLSSGFKYSDDRVVHDGNLITSQGPGTTFEFALKIVEYLEGIEKMQSVKEPMRLNF